MRFRQIPWKWILVSLAVLLLVGIVVVPRQIGTSADLRDRVAAALTEWTGATITLTEPLSVRYFPSVSLRGGLVLTNATKLPMVRSITAKDFKISLSLPALLVGHIDVDSLRLVQPKITLKDTVTERPDTLAVNALADSPVDAIRIRSGMIETASGERLVSDLNARFDASGGGALSTFGSFDFRDKMVSFVIDSGTISEQTGTQKTDVTLSVTSDPVVAKFSGVARSGEAFALDGDMQVEMPDARGFLNWVGLTLPEGKSLQNLSASGPVYWNGVTLIFADGVFTLDGNSAVGLLAVTTGKRPKVDGTLAFEKLTLDPYLADTEAAEGELFDWALLKYLDADLRISAGEVSASTMRLGRGGFTVTARNGAISSEVGELELCEGDVSGRIGLDLSSPRTRASFDGNLSNIAMEPCLAPFGLRIPIKGVGSVKLDVSTGGHTQDELVRGLAGDLKVTAQNGSVPIDLPQLMSGGESSDGWTSQNVTPFTSLDADCRLSAGHIWCQSFKMETGRGLVSGSGSVDVGRQTLDWDLSIANPVAQLSASQLVMEAPQRVIISGPLTKPLIQRANRSTLGDVPTQSGSGDTPVSPR